MKFLVTGGAGFLGSHIAKRLIDKGHSVTILDDLSGGYERNVPDGATLITGSIVDRQLVDEIFEDGQFDYVYHCAAYAAEGLSHFVRHYNYTNNVIGSINLINASIRHNIKSFTFTSSMGTYGTQKVPYVETMKPIPEDPYGIAKYSIEQDLATAYEMFGLNYIIYRPQNIYGPQQDLSDRYRNVIGIFINQAMKNEDITVYGDGEQTRAFSYIDDVSEIMAQSYDNESMFQNIFNIGGNTPYTINEIAESVIKSTGSKSNIIHMPERFEVKHAYSCHDKIRQHYDLKQTPLRQGIDVMAKWAKELGPQEFRTMKYELDKNIHEAWK